MNLLHISFYFYNKQTLLLNFPYSAHSNQSTILTYFSHFHSDIVKAVSGCQTGLPWQRYAPYSSSNHKSVFLSHQRLLFPLTLQSSAIKRRCKNRGNGSILVLVRSLRPEMFNNTKRSNTTSFTNLQSSKHFFENIMSCKDISTHFSLFWKWKAFSICGSSCRQQYQQSTDEFDEVSKSRPPIRSDVNFLLGLWLAGGLLTWENIVRGS